MSSLPSSPTPADLYAWNLSQFDAETLQKIWWTNHGSDSLVNNFDGVFGKDGPYRGTGQIGLLMMLVKERYPNVESPVLDRIWREKGFSVTWKDMKVLFDQARKEGSVGGRNGDEEREKERKEGTEREMRDGMQKMNEIIHHLAKISSLLERKQSSDDAMLQEIRPIMDQIHQHFGPRPQVASTSTTAPLPVATKTESNTGSEWTEVEEAHRGAEGNEAAKGAKEEMRGQVEVLDDVW